MKNTIILITLATLTFLFNGCEKVIDIDLDESEQHIIIEANLQEGEHDFLVVISKSAPYFDNQSPETIENAQVTLFDESNNSFAVPHVSNGEYIIHLNGVNKMSYTLEVEIEGTTYTASSYLPQAVKIDTAYAIFEEAFGPHEAGYHIYFEYTDPITEENYYRSRYYLNNTFQNSASDLRIFNDKLNDGNKIEQILSFDQFNENDSLLIELIHFDKASYDYFSTLADIISSTGPHGGSAAPANPNTNWKGGCLGYFSAYSKDTISVLVPELPE